MCCVLAAEEDIQSTFAEACGFAVDNGHAFAATCTTLGILMELGIEFGAGPRGGLAEVVFKGLNNHCADADIVDCALVTLQQIVVADWLEADAWRGAPKRSTMRPGAALKVLRKVAETQLSADQDGRDFAATIMVRLLWIVGFVAFDGYFCDLIIAVGWAAMAMEVAAKWDHANSEINAQVVRMLDNVSQERRLQEEEQRRRGGGRGGGI